ncbi:MAG: hypothetical protein ABSH14_05585 [Verrucomicrobiia bacterium]
MNITMYLGIILGVIIGGAFAWLQLLALRRNELLEKREQVPTLLRQIPGSGGRVAFLLIALVLAQVLFQSASVVWMAAGVAVAYAIPFVMRLKVKYQHR